MPVDDKWMTRERVIDMVQECGYRALAMETPRNNMIRSSVSGLTYIILIYPELELQFSIGFSVKDKDAIPLERINRLNAQYRFLKAMLDEEGDLVMQMDVSLVAIDPDRAKDAVENALGTWERAVEKTRRLLETAMDENDEDEIESDAGSAGASAA